MQNGFINIKFKCMNCIRKWSGILNLTTAFSNKFEQPKFKAHLRKQQMADINSSIVLLANDCLKESFNDFATVPANETHKQKRTVWVRASSINIL
jgi:hypothetical protein